MGFQGGGGVEEASGGWGCRSPQAVASSCKTYIVNESSTVDTMLLWTLLTSGEVVHKRDPPHPVCLPCLISVTLEGLVEHHPAAGWAT